MDASERNECVFASQADAAADCAPHCIPYAAGGSIDPSSDRYQQASRRAGMLQVVADGYAEIARLRKEVCRGGGRQSSILYQANIFAKGPSSLVCMRSPALTDRIRRHAAHANPNRSWLALRRCSLLRAARSCGSWRVKRGWHCSSA
jgi:hypothetical protein